MLHQQTLRLCVQLFPLTLLTGTSTRCLPAELRAGKADLSAPELFREGDLSVRHTLTLNSSFGSLLLQISRWKVRRELSSQADKIITICSDIPLNYAASPWIWSIFYECWRTDRLISTSIPCSEDLACQMLLVFCSFFLMASSICHNSSALFSSTLWSFRPFASCEISGDTLLQWHRRPIQVKLFLFLSKRTVSTSGWRQWCSLKVNPIGPKDRPSGRQILLQSC